MTKHPFIVTRSVAPEMTVTDEYLPPESTEKPSTNNSEIEGNSSLTEPYFDEEEK